MDIIIFNAIHSLAGQLKFLDWIAVFLAKYLPYLLALGALIFILKQGLWKTKFFVFIFIALTTVLSRGILTETIRFLYQRQRPFEVLGFSPLVPNDDPSFPSGHAAMFFALALAMFKFNKRLGLWFLVLAFLVGLARIFAGIHWPSDIFGGFVIALVSFLVVVRLIKTSSTPQESV